MAVYTNVVPPTCRRGDKSNAVKFMQFCLKRDGYQLEIDGSMGTMSQQELIKHQLRRKLKPDGICGAKTWLSLLNGGNELTHFMQNDPLWKETQYSSINKNSQTIGNSGCGPTSLAIALSGYGVKAKPPEVASLAVAGGHRQANGGTLWSMFADIAPKFGHRATKVNYDEVVKALAAGNLVIASMRPGDYTKGGHFICVRDHDPFAKLFYTVDPISRVRCSCTEDVIKGQAKAFWIIS